MNMLSRVLKNDAVETKPVAWRRGLGIAKSGSSRRPKPVPLSEAEQHRVQIAELNAAAELQARQAYDRGVRAGEAAARKELAAGVRTTLEKLAATISEIASVRSESIHRAEADAVHLVLAIARRVLHRELSLNANVVEDLIKAALDKLQAQEVYRVRVHPDQEEMLKRCLGKTGRGQAVTVVPDPTQSEGGAVFETSRGLLDASLDTQLDEIERILADQLEARS
jgi:flagellar assembly protein FliH